MKTGRKPRKLLTDRCGDAYCPNCKCWLAEYHTRTKSIGGLPRKYCSNCGQKLLWEIDWDEE